MWLEALKVAVVGFSGVFVALLTLAGGVQLMSLFFKHTEKDAGEVKK